MITEQINPPAPCRSHDWQATHDDYQPGDPMGFGPTEQDAINDLLEQS